MTGGMRVVCYLYTTALFKRDDGEAEKDPTRRSSLASFRKDLEKSPVEGIPSLEEMESGTLVGAVLPLSERAQTQMRNSIEVIDYLLNQDHVIWS
jgi:hypothetical protein